jgi:hypothetical protein
MILGVQNCVIVGDREFVGDDREGVGIDLEKKWCAGYICEASETLIAGRAIAVATDALFVRRGGD